jgi:hypothetical protein
MTILIFMIPAAHASKVNGKHATLPYALSMSVTPVGGQTTYSEQAFPSEGGEEGTSQGPVTVGSTGNFAFGRGPIQRNPSHTVPTSQPCRWTKTGPIHGLRRGGFSTAKSPAKQPLVAKTQGLAAPPPFPPHVLSLPGNAPLPEGAMQPVPIFQSCRCTRKGQLCASRWRGGGASTVKAADAQPLVAQTQGLASNPPLRMCYPCRSHRGPLSHLGACI